VRLLTVGHGTAARDEFAALLRDAEIKALVDVRRAPGSRRSPQFSRAELAEWLPAAGIGYQWEPDLGGFRKTSPDSPNTALRNPSFRGYADYMSTDQFRAALDRVLARASDQMTTVMCAETVWWRCHRRLIADFATLVRGVEVLHLGHDGRLSAHELTSGVRRDSGSGSGSGSGFGFGFGSGSGSGGGLRYDGGQGMLLGAEV